MSMALIWVYALPDDSTKLSPLVAMVVSDMHVCTVGINDSTNPWNTTVMSSMERAHAPLTRHAEQMEKHGYSLLIAPTTVELASDEVAELDAENKVKPFLTLRIKRMIAGAK